MTVLLEDGNLTIDPFDFLIGGGKDSAKLSLRSREKPATMDVILKIDQLDLGAMAAQLTDERPVEGTLEMALDLKGSGDSVAALMAGLDGNIHTAVRDGKAYSRYLELLERYLGSNILRLFNPFQSKSEYTPVNCLVNVIEINDGLADIKLLLDTDQTSIISAGNINLKTEALDLGIKPKPKKGFMGTGVSLRQLSQPFRLGGTLADPSLVMDPGRTVLTLGKLGGALFLGPAGIPLFFGDISLDSAGPCAKAIEEAGVAGKQSGTKKKEEPKADTKEGEQKKSKGFFRRLIPGL